MIELTKQMSDLIDNNLANKTPCILATATAAGEPGVSFRGSMMVFDNEHLAFWDRSKRANLEHLGENPKVAVMFYNPAERVSWKFHGIAEIHRDGAIREQVMARTVESELARDPNREGVAVVIRVDRVARLNGEVLQIRE